MYLYGKPVKIDTDTKLNAQEQQLMISLDEERALEAVDPECRELCISVGCYIESLVFAFEAYGYDAMVEYVDVPDTHSEIATISYCKRENVEIDSKKIETIKCRHTDKRSYNTDKINAEVITQLLKDADGIYCYERGSEEFEYLKSGTIESISKQSTVGAYRKELSAIDTITKKSVKRNDSAILQFLEYPC